MWWREYLASLVGLKRTVVVGRIRGDGLAAIPQFHNLVTLKAKHVEHRHPTLSGIHDKMRVNHNKVAIAEDIFRNDLFVWELLVVLLHRLLQSRNPCRKEWVVMYSPHVDVLSVCFIDATCDNKLQEIYRGLLAILDAALSHDDTSSVGKLDSVGLFLRLWISIIDHPLNSKFVRHHPEVCAPECVTEGHRDLASLRESLEELLCFVLALSLER